MNGRLAFFICLISFLSACELMEEEHKTIGQVNFNRYQDQLRSAQSEQQIKQLDSIIFEVIRDSSVNRLLPDVWAEDQYGVKVNLSLLIDKPSLMVITSPYAQWNSIDIAREIPDAAELIEGDKRIICLLLEEPAPKGADIPVDFYKVQLEQLAELFSNSYLIKREEAQKLNLFALPTRFYFDEDGVLKSLSPTAVSPNRLKAEIKSNFN